MSVDGKLEAFLSRVKDVRKSGKGWSARCPAHDDRHASLSISEGDDRRVLVRCHAGCSVEAICAAVNLTPADLFEPSTSTETRQTRGKEQYRRHDDQKPTGKAYLTAHEAVAALDQFMERKHEGQRATQWTYTDAEGTPVALVVRYNLPTQEGERQQKTFRPVSKHPDGWRWCDPPGKWPLYRLPDLADAKRVYVGEGEGVVEEAQSIGLIASTSAHGSQSPGKTDWTPLSGTEIVILPDNDPPGRKYTEKVGVILAKLVPAVTAKIVELPDLPEHGDLVDFVAKRRAEGKTDDEIRAEVEALAAAADVFRPTPPKRPFKHFKPFPTTSLPQPVRGYVEAGSKAIGCDPCYIALPLLCGLAAAIGATRRIRLKADWHEPSVLWGAILGESGTLKSPSQQLALDALARLQTWQLEQYPELAKQYERDVALFQADMQEWKKKGRANGEPLPEKPMAPTVPRYIVSEITLEALAERLQENPRGLLVTCDELKTWLAGFDKYRGGHGGDVGHWLAMHRAGILLWDRKTGTNKTILVRHAAASVVGGIQPETYSRALGIEHLEDGLAARLLVAMPPRRPKRWSEATVDPTLKKRIEKVFGRLLALEFGTDQNDCPAPIDLPLTPDAKTRWVRFVNTHGEEQAELNGVLASVWSKLEAYAARFALVIHLVRLAADDPSLADPDSVDEQSINMGVELAEWFGYEAERVYAALNESDEDRDRRQLIEWIGRKGGSVTAREVQQGHRRFPTSEDAEGALEELVKAGYGEWEPTPAGRRGQPTRRFVLFPAFTVYGNTPNRGENANTVDVDSVDVPETQSDDDEWGEI